MFKIRGKKNNTTTKKNGMKWREKNTTVNTQTFLWKVKQKIIIIKK